MEIKIKKIIEVAKKVGVPINKEFISIIKETFNNGN